MSSRSPDPSKSPEESTVTRTRESLWKRSKRTLGTTQFAFLQGKVAGEQEVGDKDEKGDKSKVAPSKRREQVRRAQRTHRQRTEAYVKTLEDEVVRLRKSESTTLRKNIELQSELDRLKAYITSSHSGTNQSPFAVQSSSFGDSQTQLSSISSTVDPDAMAVDNPDMMKTVGVKFYEGEGGVLTLGTDRFNPLPQFRSSAFNALDVGGIGLEGEEGGYHRSPPPPPPPPRSKDRIVLVTDDYQTGIDFVLLLEAPCIPHISPHRHPHQSQTSKNDSTGHVLTASVSLLNQYEGPNAIEPGTSWAVTPNDIERLLYLSSSLQLQGEITPVEAWNRVRLHPGFRSLSMVGFERLKGELRGLVSCYGFGAALDESTFHDTIDRVLYSGDAF